MGSVWRAHHLGLEAPVAVKLMDPAVMRTPGMLARFHREAQAAAQLRSPHVVQIFDHGVDEASRTPFIVMELLEGESLLDRQARFRVLPPRETSLIVTDVCRALGRAHEMGIIHRDLKPANLFLVNNDDHEITKVLDFGIAKSQFVLNETTTNSGSILGTPLYMSPEQISGNRAVDPRSDLWSLAVVACECLTGKKPFSADSIGALTLVICIEPLPKPSRLGSVPAGFDAWFERAVARDPAERFQTAKELAEELRRVCGLTSARGAGSLDSDDRASSMLGRLELREDGIATEPQWGEEGRVSGARVDALPLAPTVDVKEAATGNALSKSSHDLARVVPRSRSRARVAAALGLVSALVIGLVAVSRMLSSASSPESGTGVPLSRSIDTLTPDTTSNAKLPSPPEVAVAAVPVPLGPPSLLPGAGLPPPADAERQSSFLRPAAPPKLTPSSVPSANVPAPPSASNVPAPPSASPQPSAAAPPAASGASPITLESVIDQRR
jgi:serine/threonine-protein kinase